MVQIGEIEYRAKVTGAAEAKSQTEDLQESQEDLADASEDSATSLNGFAGSIRSSGDASTQTGRQTGVLDHSLRLLGSTAHFVGGSIVGLIAKVTGLGGVMATGAKAVGLLKGALAGLTLKGILGSVVGAVKGFGVWLAAGSAGALAFAGAIGAGLGVLGAWILHTTGALDAVGRFGAFVRDVAPDWVADGILQILSLFAGPLAALGGFIIGTFEGGFSEGVARAREVTQIFVGAWERQIGRVRDFASNSWSRITSGAENMKDRVVGFFGDIEDAATGTVRSGFNAVVPDSVSIPSVTLSAPSWAGGMSTTIGGQSIDLPQLSVGGRIEESGAAVVHEGEAVIPEPIVSAAEGADTDGGGDGGVTVEDMTLIINADSFDPSDLSRRDVKELADRLTKAMGRKTSSRAGTR